MATLDGKADWDSDFVLMVCTETYYKRVVGKNSRERGSEYAGKGSDLRGNLPCGL